MKSLHQETLGSHSKGRQWWKGQKSTFSTLQYDGEKPLPSPVLGNELRASSLPLSYTLSLR